MKRNKNFDREKSPSIFDPFRIFIENKKERKGKERRRKMRKQVEKKTRLEIYIFSSRFTSNMRSKHIDSKRETIISISFRNIHVLHPIQRVRVFFPLSFFLVFLISRNLRGSINKTR